jgi:hypothetical protein
MNDDLRGLAAREQPAPVATGSRPVWDEVILRFQESIDWSYDQDCAVGLISSIAARLGRDEIDIIDDMRQRDAMGRERYGVPLTADNGRNHLVDAYQEALDLLVYLVAAEMAND